LLSFGAESFLLQSATQKYKVQVTKNLIIPVVLCGSELGLSYWARNIG
jgi:hypothetical protein